MIAKVTSGQEKEECGYPLYEDRERAAVMQREKK